jgi:ATP-binding cassette, subfamily B, multidrug efflux pump
MKKTNKVDFKLYQRLLQYFKPYKTELIFAFLVTIISALSALTPPYIVKYTIDNFITNNEILKDERLQSLIIMLIVYLAFLLVDFLLKFLKGYLTGKVGQKAIRDLRINVFSHLQSLSLRYYDKNPIGRLMTRVTNDVEALNDMFTQGVVTIFGDLFMIIGIVAALVTINAKLALWTFSVLPLLFIISFIFRINVRKNLLVVRSLVAKLNAFMQEHITGILIVKLFNRNEQTFDKFKTINKDHTDSWIKNVQLYSLYFPTVELISSIAIALIIWNSSLQVQNSEVSFGTIVLFIQMAQMFFRPISDLSEKYNIIQSAMAASERIFDVLDTETEIKSKENAEKVTNFNGKIDFKNVWFSYKKDNIEESDYILKDISFTVKPGEHMAIVGHTGAGKSTIINLINRFYDIQKGQILVDDIDIKDWDVPTLRSYIGIVLQDIYLFSGSVYDNIALNNPEITHDEIENSCKTVEADSFIRKLPQGYHTKIKERGSILSVGQKQLLSFARALVFNPSLLILDEATSSIDTDTETLIQTAMKNLMLNRTSIIIAHRLSTIKDADQIIVMHNGEIREKGKHQSLLNNKGLYFKLYQLQYQDQEIEDKGN